MRRWQHPLQIENTNWHQSVSLPKECEWKQGESAVVNAGAEAEKRASEWSAVIGEPTKNLSMKVALTASRLPLVGSQPHR
jgi:hypothetical protein